MNEDRLREYWLAYTDALKLIKNWKQVNGRHISQMIKKHNIGTMPRLFCLVVWQEIKELKIKGGLSAEVDYQQAFTKSWKLFKQYSNPDDSDRFWDGLIENIHSLGIEYGESQFIKNLLIYVTLEEIERIARQKGESREENGEYKTND